MTDSAGTEKSTQAANQDKIVNRSLEIVILAAGQGTRMRSALPKVLHPLAGRPMLYHAIDTARSLGPARIHIVIGHQGDAVRAAFDPSTESPQGQLRWVEQTVQKGTGHAVAQALAQVDDASIVLVTYGDVPLVSADTLRRCVQMAESGGLALVTANFEDPAELGRIVREPGGAIRAIVEFADASPAERELQEINSGILALDAALMKSMVSDIEPHNAQGEFYLTDMVALAVERNIEVSGLVCTDPREVCGINDRAQLAEAERVYQGREAVRLMAAGVSIADPARIDVRGRVVAGEDCFIDVNVVFEGEVRLGRGVRIGPGSVIKDSQLGDDVQVGAHTVIEGATAAAGCLLGPFARIRAGTELAEGVKIGNFVETKKARIGRGTKASHLTYLGDVTLGAGCNVGAGTVTCNYDGVDKHHTNIGERVFVGTNSTLVAPVNIGSDAFVAAGSTVTTTVKEGDLAVGRGRQRNISGWTRPDRRGTSRGDDK